MNAKKLSIRDRAMAAAASQSFPTSAPGGVSPRVKTGPGALVAHLANESEVMRENDSLREELRNWSGASPTKKIDPAVIGLSKWANRDESSYRNKEFSDLKEDIVSAGGNVQPIKVRPIAGSDKHYEIVFGHRRHRACLEVGLPVLALVESITDQALFTEMDRENRSRADLRPYEQGEMYRRALDDGLYKSLRALAEAVGAQPGNVSTAISLARLPKEVLDAFPSRMDIQYRWGAQLSALVDKSRDVILAAASDIHELRSKGVVLSAKDVFDRLCSGSKHRDDVKVAILSNGRAFATLTEKHGRCVITFENGVVTPEGMAKLQTFLEGFAA